MSRDKTLCFFPVGGLERFRDPPGVKSSANSFQSSKLKVIFPGGVSGDPGEGSGLAGFSSSGRRPGLRRGWWRSPGKRTEEGNPVSRLPKGGTGPLSGAVVRGPNMAWGWTGGHGFSGADVGGFGEPGVGEGDDLDGREDGDPCWKGAPPWSGDENGRRPIGGRPNGIIGIIIGPDPGAPWPRFASDWMPSGSPEGCR